MATHTCRLSGWVILLFFQCFNHIALCQKKPLDFESFGRWDGISAATLSDDGKYVAYIHHPNGKLVLVLRALDGSFSRKISNGEHPVFIGSRCIQYQLPGDTVAVLNLKTGETIFQQKTMQASLTDPMIADIKSAIGQQLPGFVLLNNYFTYSNDKSVMLVSVKRTIAKPEKKSDKIMNIWHYNDLYLPTQPFQSFGPQKEQYKALYYPNKKRIILADSEWSEVVNYQHFNKYLLLKSGPATEAYYKKDQWPTLTLMSVKDRKRKIIFDKEFSGFGYSTNPVLSANDKYVVWFNADELSYYSYEIATGITRNISEQVPTILYNEEALAANRRGSYGVAGWGGTSVYLYDEFDIWKIDLTDRKPALNITKGEGRNRNIVFYFSPIQDETAIADTKLMTLMAYSKETKENGFWKLRPGKPPEMLTMEPVCIYLPPLPRINLGYIGYAKGQSPVKAKNANVYLVSKQSADNSLNLYVTKDFISYEQISNIRPEKSVNWLTSELITWQLPDGHISRGILYKPENFDSTKKYPLIFDYYEKRSDELHQYIAPDYCHSRINIPYFVSNGYLIFVPDIYYKPGYNGKGAVDAITSAARFLSKYSWVDISKMGLQGHSFGGWQTNFLVTHTNIFAAACEASGVSDVISGYGQIITSSDFKEGYGGARGSFYETSSQGAAYGVNVTPWTQTGTYVRNSPVLFVDKVTTPLLMMHGRRDIQVPFAQAVEFFTALKRAGKKVWLLDYPNGGHALSGDMAIDYTIRVKAFFDHYLMNGTMPDWMK